MGMHYRPPPAQAQAQAHPAQAQAQLLRPLLLLLLLLLPPDELARAWKTLPVARSRPLRSMTPPLTPGISMALGTMVLLMRPIVFSAQPAKEAATSPRVV